MVVYFNIDNGYTQTSASNGTSANPFDFAYLLSGTSGFGMTSAITTDVDIYFKISGYRKDTYATASNQIYNLKNESMIGNRFYLEPWNDSNDGWGLQLRVTNTSYYGVINIGSLSASNWTIIKKAIIGTFSYYAIQTPKIVFNNVYAYSCFFRLYVGGANNGSFFAINNCNGHLALSRFFGCTFSNENVATDRAEVIDIKNNAVNNYVDFYGCILIDVNNWGGSYAYIHSRNTNNPAKIRVKYCISNKYLTQSNTYDEGTYSRNTMIKRSDFSVGSYPTMVEPLSSNGYNTKETFFQIGTWPPGGNIGNDNDNWKYRVAYYYNALVNPSAIPLINSPPAGWTIEDLPTSWGI